MVGINTKSAGVAVLLLGGAKAFTVTPATGGKGKSQLGLKSRAKGNVVINASKNSSSDEDSSSAVPFFASVATSTETREKETGTTMASPSPSSVTKQEEVSGQVSDALNSVGWSAPMTEDELTSADPFVQRIDAQIQQESGVGLDELLNPAKVSFL